MHELGDAQTFDDLHDVHLFREFGASVRLPLCLILQPVQSLRLLPAKAART